ncbi:transposase family protein [Streptomyces pseudogriseolus]|uniref:transposase family protein n=1 Tax=Streptomyces pseudogriseolus TaxID=36817 RepID=UPI003FA24BCB
MPAAFGLMVLSCARGTARTGRASLLAGSGDQGGVVEDDGGVIRVGVRCRAAEARCPGCGSWAGRVHGSYLRLPDDLPAAGRRVVLRLRVRRFVCEASSCGRRTFVEQVPGLTRRYSRRTERLRSAMAEVGLAVAGRAGARPADIFGAGGSRNTVLRLHRRLRSRRALPRTGRAHRSRPRVREDDH